MNDTTVEITCPGCGTVSHFDQVRRNAQEFCRRCDFPLFWVRSGDAPPDTGSEGDVGLRRLPGAGGRQVVASLGCPRCNEPNLYTATLCIRCGADLRPAPPTPPPAPVIVEPPAAPPEPEPEVGPIWPYYVALIGLPVAVALALLAVVA
jgi:uncharacterized protein (DUF983 family)